MGISAAMKMGSIVKTKIEEEIHKHQHHEEGSGEEGEENKGESSEDNASSDAVGGDDVLDDDEGDDDDDEAASAEANRWVCVVTFASCVVCKSMSLLLLQCIYL